MAIPDPEAAPPPEAEAPAAVPTGPAPRELAAPPPPAPRETPARALTDAEFQAAARGLTLPGMNARPLPQPPGWAAAECRGSPLPKGHGYELVLTLRGGPSTLEGVRQAGEAEKAALAKVAAEIDSSPEAEAVRSAGARLERLRQGEAGARAHLDAAAKSLDDAADPEAVRRHGKKVQDAQAALESFAGPLAKAERDLTARAADLERFASACLDRHRSALLHEVAAALPNWKTPVAVGSEANVGEWLARLVWASTLQAALANGRWGWHHARRVVAALLPPAPQRQAPAAVPNQPMGLSRQDVPVI
jgi:hypothetical protein